MVSRRKESTVALPMSQRLRLIRVFCPLAPSSSALAELRQQLLQVVGQRVNLLELRFHLVLAGRVRRLEVGRHLSTQVPARRDEVQGDLPPLLDLLVGVARLFQLRL